jgi:hypothetical protein
MAIVVNAAAIWVIHGNATCGINPSDWTIKRARKPVMNQGRSGCQLGLLLLVGTPADSQFARQERLPEYHRAEHQGPHELDHGADLIA